ncbi:MAG: DUF58 domain-containing protein, partial [Calditrichia bacterium]|nr:DUF58 domain-containing protein [Calditrichia bacterium]
ARAIVEGFMVGLHKSLFHGFSAEFSEYRQYFKGDDIRLIDWNAAARTEKLFVKQFEEETNLTAHIILDISNSMGYSSHEIKKIEYAEYLISALGYLLFKQRDNFALTAFDDKIQIATPARHSLNHLYYIFSLLEKVEISGKTALFTTLQKVAERIKKRGLVILISDFLFEDIEKIKKGLLQFGNKKNEIIVFHLADPGELNFNFSGETLFEDMETGEKIKTQAQQVKKEVQNEINSFFGEIKKFCLNHRIDYQLINTEESFFKALISFLIKRKQMF